MALDPQVQEFLEQTAAENVPATHQVPPEEARRLFRLKHERLDNAPETVARDEERSIAGPGGNLPLRIYTPQGEGQFPALVYFHGGGWLVGDLSTLQSACSFLANAVPCVVISVNYRLAPENKFPAAVEDCYSALKWVAGNARSLNINPGEIAVGGDSAGGNLAAAVSLVARDRCGPALAYQLLIYPVIDFNFDRPSYKENATGYLLTQEACRYLWKQYLENESDANNPYASPIRAESLAGLPPAMVLTAQYDPLRDEGQDYARRLLKAGVPVIARNYEGLIHGFWGMGAVLDQTHRIRQEVAEVLHTVFSQIAAATA